jgi:hypothetical protein
MKKHYFYDQLIIRRSQEDYIRQLMKKYQNEPVSDELRKKVWDELQMEKHRGKITIPFKIAVRMDPYGILKCNQASKLWDQENV